MAQVRMNDGRTGRLLRDAGGGDVLVEFPDGSQQAVKGGTFTVVASPSPNVGRDAVQKDAAGGEPETHAEPVLSDDDPTLKAPAATPAQAQATAPRPRVSGVGTHTPPAGG